MFQFKQFSIQQDHSAMKVGTDGVLLGAWSPVEKANRVLDIGTGTGLIALMIAQRNQNANIHAVELETQAFAEATTNFKTSPWAKRLKAVCSDIQRFKTLMKYDLIVSNPPYFTDTFKNNNSEKALARHVDNLSFEQLILLTSNLLTKEGLCAFVIPFQEEEDFIKLAQKHQFYVQKITRVKGRIDLPFKRSLLCFSKIPCTTVTNELVIEIDRHVYTKDYIALTQDFYLKM